MGILDAFSLTKVELMTWLGIIGGTMLTPVIVWQGIGLLVKRWRVRSWRAVAGVVEAASIKEVRLIDNGPMHFKAVFRYRYVVYRTRYHGERVSEESTTEETPTKARACLARYPVGSKVVVYYNPEAPQEATLDVTFERLAWQTLGLGLAGAGAYGLFMLYLGIPEIESRLGRIFGTKPLPLNSGTPGFFGFSPHNPTGLPATPVPLSPLFSTPAPWVGAPPLTPPR